MNKNSPIKKEKSFFHFFILHTPGKKLKYILG